MNVTPLFLHPHPVLQLKNKMRWCENIYLLNQRIKYLFIKSPISFAVLKAQKINESVPLGDIMHLDKQIHYRARGEEWCSYILPVSKDVPFAIFKYK